MVETSIANPHDASKGEGKFREDSANEVACQTVSETHRTHQPIESVVLANGIVSRRMDVFFPPELGSLLSITVNTVNSSMYIL